MSISGFIDDLSSVRLPNMFNPWGERCKFDLGANAHQERRDRLFQHLNSPDIQALIIGEAPGHLGCRYSGIAFTSEHQLVSGRVPRIVNTEGRRLTTFDEPLVEPSASSVWSGLESIGYEDKVVMFNAVPWHPHEPNNGNSNRPPTAKEKRYSRDFLSQFLTLYKGLPVVSLGRVSEVLIQDVGMTSLYVRHPSRGGSTKCKEGLVEFLTTL